MRVITIIPIIIITLLVVLFIERIPENTLQQKVTVSTLENDVVDVAEEVKEEIIEIVEAPVVSPMVGKTLPPFSLPSIYENYLGVSTMDVRGRTSLINVFASWCVPCLEEHKHLKTVAGYGVPVYGIAWRDDKDKLQRWLKDNGNPYEKIGYDEKGKTLVEFGVSGVPESFIVDEDMKVLWHYRGPLTPVIIRNEIQPLL